jgi:hypothetical protein
LETSERPSPDNWQSSTKREEIPSSLLSKTESLSESITPPTELHILWTKFQKSSDQELPEPLERDSLRSNRTKSSSSRLKENRTSLRDSMPSSANNNLYRFYEFL